MNKNQSPIYKDYQQENWYLAMTEEEKTLAKTTMALLAEFDPQQSTIRLDDYSFAIFPISKAYEGFLKSFLLKENLIDYETYISKKWRLGRAMNPDISQSQQDELWFYDDLVRRKGEAVARQTWNTWLVGRNHIFHFFPEAGHDLFLTYDQAVEKVTLIIDTISSLVED